MDRKYMMKAERSQRLFAFADYYGTSALEEKLRVCWNADEPEIHPGQEIVLCGYIGMAGTLYLAEHRREELRRVLPEHFIRTADLMKPMAVSYPDTELMKAHGVTAVYPVLEGGILSALCHLAVDSDTGFRIEYEAVPVKQLTIECCEVFDLNPWQLMSGGCTMMVAEHGYEVVQALADQGMTGHVIGYITKDQDKVICHGEIRSHLNRPEADELLKVL